MSALFLSYRRDDSSGYAGRLFDTLVARFGRENVFMDIETLEPGLDFIDGIDRAIRSCGAVVAMIGPNWLSATNSQGGRRLDDPKDFIRLEIATALKRGVRVIPVLVHDAAMPSEDELPEPLRPLCRRQSFEISDSRWEFDVGRLADVLEPVIAESAAATAPASGGNRANGEPQTRGTPPGGGPSPGSNRTGPIAALAVLLAAVLAGGWWFGLRQVAEPEATSVTTVPEPPFEEGPSPTLQTPAMGPSAAATQGDEPAAGNEPAKIVSEAPPSPPPQTSEPRSDVVAEPRPIAPPEVPVPTPAATERSAEEMERQAQAEMIAELLERARIDREELRLTRPAGENAYERYRQVLELDPDNAEAQEGLQGIVGRYHGLVEDALVRGAFDTAERHLESARSVDPGADWLLPMQEEIERGRLRAARSAAPARAAPQTRPGRAGDPEACLRDCERRDQVCRDEIDPEVEANCRRERTAECDQRHDDCMSDVSKLVIWGRASLKSECAGVHAQCERATAEECANAARTANAVCDRRLEQCFEACRAVR